MKSITIYEHNHIYQGCCKNAEPTFQCIIVLQSRVQNPKNLENYGPLFSTKIKTLSLGLENNDIWECLFDNFPITLSYVKSCQQNFNMFLFSNTMESIKILVQILWCQDLRVQHKLPIFPNFLFYLYKTVVMSAKFIYFITI